MSDILQGLNEEQRAAVTATEGYIRVIAGAGSGKTRALTHRYAYLVTQLGLSTSDIVCVTFTNKAANEMKKRIRTMIGDNDTGYITTFHGLCVQMLREDIHLLRFPKSFVVMDEEDSEAILRTVYETCDIPARAYTYEMARRDICAAKAHNRHIPWFLELDNSKLKEACEQATDRKEKVFLGYLYEQKKCYGLDFEDLISLTLYILTTWEDVCRKWQERFMYIMVDEFQDVSNSQYLLATILSAYHGNLFIVGDPDQTIYSWRGADVNYILDFDKKFPGAQTIVLNRNYRSTPNILDASNALIRNNRLRMEKDLIAMKGASVPVIYNHARTTQEEAAWIVRQIRRITESGDHTFSDIAILYRSHYVSRSVEELFIREKIPYTLYSGVEFYKRKEIKDMLCYLRMILCGDDLSFSRVVNEPRRNIGKKRMGFLTEYAELHDCSLYNALKENLETELFAGTQAGSFIALIEHFRTMTEELSVSELMARIMNQSGYESMLRTQGEQERLDNLAELKQAIFHFEETSGEENTLEEYLQQVALFTRSDREESKNSVKLMTIHTAKGLEFPYVFVCGMNEGIFPTKHVDTRERLEEERRLAYVAYTRAENALFLSDAEGENFDGSYRYPSRFIFNTGRKYLDYTVELEQRLVENAEKFICANERKIDNPVPEWKEGDEVEHAVFGVGKIIGLRQDIGACVVQFEKIATPRNIAADKLKLL